MFVDKPAITDFGDAQHGHGTAAEGGPLVWGEKFYVPGTYSAGQKLWDGPALEEIEYLENLEGCFFFCDAAPADIDVVISIKFDGVAVATVTFPVGHNTDDPGVMACDPWATVIGKRTKVFAPLVPSTSFAGLSVGMRGRRVSNGA